MSERIRAEFRGGGGERSGSQKANDHMTGNGHLFQWAVCVTEFFQYKPINIGNVSIHPPFFFLDDMK